MRIFLTILFIIFCYYLVVSLSIAPYVPTRKKDLERISKLVKLKPGMRFCDMGCGDARVLLYLARKNPEVKFVGIELFWPVYIVAIIKTKLSSLSNVEIKFGNAMKYDLGKVDRVFTFAFSKSMNATMKKKFEEELRPDAKIISYGFRMKEWEGNKEKYNGTGDQNPVFIYSK